MKYLNVYPLSNKIEPPEMMCVKAISKIVPRYEVCHMCIKSVLKVSKVCKGDIKLNKDRSDFFHKALPLDQSA